MKRYQSILLILTVLILGLITRSATPAQTVLPKNWAAESQEMGSVLTHDLIEQRSTVVRVEASELGDTMIDPTHEACCRIRAGNGIGTGTCFLIGDNGDAFFLTNHHVAGKKGSNVKVELWRDGKLQPALNGRVVLGMINNGYVDGAVVRVSAQEVAKYGSQEFIPISLPSEPAPEYSTIISRGCPGGTWQTQFVGSVFDRSADVIKFHPRPGGGRSGSSVLDPKTGKIVALIAWSSGKPNHEQHGTDGYSPSSGHGIAMNRDVIWSILQGKMPTTEAMRPVDEIPLLHQIPLTLASLQDDDDFLTNPEDYEASLRRLKERREQQQGEGGGAGPILPKLLPQREFKLGDRLIGFVVKIIVLVIVLAVLAFFGYRLAKRYLPLMLGCLVLMLPAAAEAQDDYHQKLKNMADRWSMDAVTEFSPWTEFAQAADESAKSGLPLIVLITMDNCPPCDKLKAELEGLAADGWLNNSYMARLNHDAKLIQEIKQLAPPNGWSGYPVLMIYTMDRTDQATNPNAKPVWHRRISCGYIFAEENATVTDGTRVTLRQYLQSAGVR